MTTFTETWDATYETLPPDTGEAASQGASRMRSIKQAVQERGEVDHSWAGDTHDGKHLKSTYKVLGSDPTLDSGDGAVYTKTVSTRAELFYKDSDGNVQQLTSNGALNSFPAGTKMVFQQTAAPTGWTKDTTHNNKAFRVVTGSVSSGGATAFDSVFGSSKVTGGTAPGTDSQGAHSHTITVATHVLSTAEMPAHTHTMAQLSATGTSGGVHTVTGQNPTGSPITGSTGGGNAHGHSGSSSNSTGAHTHTVSSHTHTLSLDLQYVDLIIATKD